MTAAPRDDRILPLARAVAILVTPILLVAFGLLYVRSPLASAMFAWPIKPQLTAMLLGSAYLGGVVFFCSLLAARSWHRVALGLPAVATFASLLLVTTLLHRDLFSFDRASGWAWTIVYVVAPPLVVLAWFTNRRRDPGPVDGEPMLPVALGRLIVAVGAGAIGVAVLLYAVPTLFIDLWPWPMTPLSARVLAPMICLPGVVLLGIARDGRRSSVPTPMIAEVSAIVAMLIAMVVRSQDLSGPPASVAVMWLLMAASLAGSLGLLAVCRPRAVAVAGTAAVGAPG